MQSPDEKLHAASGHSRHAGGKFPLRLRAWLTRLCLLALILPLSAFAAPFAYITNNGGNTVSVIDTSNNTVTATVPVGNGPLGVAVNPAGTRVYVD